MKSKAESSSQEAACRRGLGEAISRSYHPALPELHPHHLRGAVLGRPMCDLGLDLENLPWLSVCVELAGEVWLQLINIFLVDLRWFGQESFVAPSHSWELVLLQEQFLAEPKCYPSPRTAAEALREALCSSSLTD